MSFFTDEKPANEIADIVDPKQPFDKRLGFGEKVQYSYQHTQAGEIWNSDAANHYKAEEERAKTIEEREGRPLDDVLSDYGYSPDPSLLTMAPESDPGAFLGRARGLTKEQALKIYRQNQTDKGYQAKILLGEALRQRGLEIGRADYEEAQRRLQKTKGGAISNFAANFIGSAGAYLFNDPYFAIVNMLVPEVAIAKLGRAASLAGRVAQRAAIEGTVGGAYEAATQPFVAANKHEMGLEHTRGDVMRNILFGTLFGATFGGAFEFGAGGLRKLKTGEWTPKQYNQHIADSFDQMSPEMRHAHETAEQIHETIGRNPYGATEEGAKKHLEELERAEQFVNNPERKAPEELTIDGETTKAGELKNSAEEADEGLKEIEALRQQFINDHPELRNKLEQKKQPDTKGVDQTILRNEDIASIETDAELMQFKSGTDKDGVNDTLRDVKEFDPLKAGIGVVYEFADGRRIIADGHQRLALARRYMAEGGDINFPAHIIKEIDGHSPLDARRIAAMKNIADGTATPIDAAKLLRESLADFENANLPRNTALVRDAEGLSKLSDEAFALMVEERIPNNYGALVGSLTPAGVSQRQLIELLDSLGPKNAFEAENIIATAIEQAKTLGRQVQELQATRLKEMDLLGRARVLDMAIKLAKKDKQLFHAILKNEKLIARFGNVLDSQQNLKVKDQAALMTKLFQRLGSAEGVIGDELTKAAQNAKQSGKYEDAARGFIEAVRPHIARFDGPEFPKKTAKSGRETDGATSTGNSDIDDVSYMLTDEGLLTRVIRNVIQAIHRRRDGQTARGFSGPDERGRAAENLQDLGTDRHAVVTEGRVRVAAKKDQTDELYHGAKGEPFERDISADLAQVPTYLRDDYGAIFYSKVGKLVAGFNNRAKPETWIKRLNTLADKEGPDLARELEWSGVIDWLGGLSKRVRPEKINEFIARNGYQLGETISHGDGARTINITVPNLEAKTGERFVAGDVENTIITLKITEGTLHNRENVAVLMDVRSKLHEAGEIAGYRPKPNRTVPKNKRNKKQHELNSLNTRIAENLTQVEQAVARWGIKPANADVTIEGLPALHKQLAEVLQHLSASDKDGVRIAGRVPAETVATEVPLLNKAIKLIEKTQALGGERDAFVKAIGSEQSQQAAASLKNQFKEQPIEAPFIDSWDKIALKRAIRWAAANGKDGVVLPAPEKVADAGYRPQGSAASHFGNRLPNVLKFINKKWAKNIINIQDEEGRFSIMLKIDDKLRREATQPMSFKLKDETKAVLAEEMAAQKQIVYQTIEELKHMLPADVAFRVSDAIQTSGGTAEAAWHRTQRLVELSATVSDPKRTIRHEAVHVLRDSGLLADDDWARLVTYAKNNQVLERNRIVRNGKRVSLREAYEAELKGRDDFAEIMDQEYVARLMEDWKDGIYHKGTVGRMIGDIMIFLEKLYNSLVGKGFTSELADERAVGKIIGDIESGKVEPRRSGVGFPHEMSSVSLSRVKAPLSADDYIDDAATIQAPPASTAHKTVYQLDNNQPRARSTTDSLKGTHIEAPDELFDWLGVKKGKFQANYEVIAAKRAEQAPYDPLAKPENMRAHVEHVLSNAAFALRHKDGNWNLVSLDGRGRLTSVDLEIKKTQYRVITAHTLSSADIFEKIKGSFDKYGDDGLKWKVDPRSSKSGGSQDLNTPGRIGFNDPLSANDYIKYVKELQAYQDRSAHPSVFQMGDELNDSQRRYVVGDGDPEIVTPDELLASIDRDLSFAENIKLCSQLAS